MTPIYKVYESITPHKFLPVRGEFARVATAAQDESEQTFWLDRNLYGVTKADLKEQN